MSSFSCENAACAVSVVEQEVLVAASLADAWDLYFEPRVWADWVDSFGSVIEIDGYPDAGGTLRWKSVPAGRGEVTEKVLEHEPRRMHRIEFSDPSLAGEMTVTFADRGRGHEDRRGDGLPPARQERLRPPGSAPVLEGAAPRHAPPLARRLRAGGC